MDQIAKVKTRREEAKQTPRKWYLFMQLHDGSKLIQKYLIAANLSIVIPAYVWQKLIELKNPFSKILVFMVFLSLLRRRLYKRK